MSSPDGTPPSKGIWKLVDRLGEPGQGALWLVLEVAGALLALGAFAWVLLR